MLDHDLDEVDGPLDVIVVVEQGLRHALADILAPSKVDDCAILGALKCLSQIADRLEVSLNARGGSQTCAGWQSNMRRVAVEYAGRRSSKMNQHLNGTYYLDEAHVCSLVPRDDLKAWIHLLTGVGQIIKDGDLESVLQQYDDHVATCKYNRCMYQDCLIGVQGRTRRV